MAVQSSKAEQLGVVLMGSFNPGIFHPQWFLRQRLISDSDAADASIDFVSSEVAEVKFAGLKLTCLHQRLTIVTLDIAFIDRLKDVVNGILINLPHLPCTACGLNGSAHFSVESEAYWHKIGHTLAPKDLWNQIYPNCGLQSLSIQADRVGDFPGKINIVLQPSLKVKPGIFLQVNSHFDVSDSNEDTSTTVIVREFIENGWSDACTATKKVAEKIFSEVKND